MKHFLPSPVMLTPFLVKYYDEEPQEALDSPEQPETHVECRNDSVQELKEEREPKLTRYTSKNHRNDCYMNPITTNNQKVVVRNQSYSRSMVDQLFADNIEVIKNNN